ncbi:glutathione S-transferase U9-like [Ipomoea triloba]|uniref:glutathione S-transferase U9-like n=1 Tax=Ipomoea triloba TaxID=35885 RepID=UPI00125E617F|nr:glutathione S-transferase U9-like [Ipomoea triloba]XP_031120029.1 glutathione S-transferase U9-like [Ipomoea triloba]XP_031120030.1 glutathione S-transferase U9-like [Ipomoea triloba]XP_031120031.1 glutathione S-transferase U9-like [Ipomoea triloba]
MEQTVGGEEKTVTLYGTWTSPYAKRVELGLRIKGIPFEYVEEDLSNKSPFLLENNPVYKKVPVLVHNGKCLSESLIILEYIDEVWSQEPHFLPADPYERSQIKFWAGYIQQVYECLLKVLTSGARDQENACKELYDKLRVLENGMGGRTNVQSSNLGLLDIMIVPTLGAYKVQEEVFGVKILDPDRNPMLHSWVNSLIELPVIKEAAAPREKVVPFLQGFKQRLALKQPSKRDETDL